MGFSPLLLVRTTIPFTTILPKKFPFAKLIKKEKNPRIKKVGEEGERERKSNGYGRLGSKYFHDAGFLQPSAAAAAAAASDRSTD